MCEVGETGGETGGILCCRSAHGDGEIATHSNSDPGEVRLQDRDRYLHLDLHLPPILIPFISTVHRLRRRVAAQSPTTCTWPVPPAKKQNCRLCLRTTTWWINCVHGSRPREYFPGVCDPKHAHRLLEFFQSAGSNTPEAQCESPLPIPLHFGFWG